jgi:hypothetical protein
MAYPAEIFAPDGTSQGTLEMADAKDDAQARALAQTRGKEWLQTSG